MSQATADAPPTTQGAAAIPPDGDHSPCMYTDYQVGFLRYLGPLFDDALHDEQANCFMEELAAGKCPVSQKRSLRRVMLAVSHERLPDLMFEELGLTPHFTPIVPDDASSSASTTATQLGPAASGTMAESH
ncbi:hypothetical protein ARMSODRAFT_1017570 [Armillaria solidipes]|uniref:Uncharacterized protein n=1 Tax=Armillaria solidipes TaxID=1076256 RepID=A0A2H3C1S0_9AGAR|nr:hypothetical protein ARMSODRAFT_1017570 [Armillaria solidipes]